MIDLTGSKQVSKQTDMHEQVQGQLSKNTRISPKCHALKISRLIQRCVKREIVAHASRERYSLSRGRVTAQVRKPASRHSSRWSIKWAGEKACTSARSFHSKFSPKMMALDKGSSKKVIWKQEPRFFSLYSEVLNKIAFSAINFPLRKKNPNLILKILNYAF